jgi:hypothetical protein
VRARRARFDAFEQWRGCALGLDEHAEAAAHDAVTVLALHGSRHTRHALVWDALHQPHVKADLVPFYDLRARKKRPSGREPHVRPEACGLGGKRCGCVPCPRCGGKEVLP